MTNEMDPYLNSDLDDIISLVIALVNINNFTLPAVVGVPVVGESVWSNYLYFMLFGE